MIEPLVALLARVGARFIGLESAVYLAAAVKVYSGPPLATAVAYAGRGGATRGLQTSPARAALARPARHWPGRLSGS